MFCDKKFAIAWNEMPSFSNIIIARLEISRKYDVDCITRKLEIRSIYLYGHQGLTFSGVFLNLNEAGMTINNKTGGCSEGLGAFRFFFKKIR